MKFKPRFYQTMAVLLLCCSCTGNVGEDKAPIFTGLTLAEEITDYAPSRSGKRRDASSDPELYETFVGEPVLLTAHFSNPNSFEILSFSINDTKYSSYMFQPGSNLTDITVEVPGSDVAGNYTYVISQIKYVDGTEIKDVKMDGNDKYTVHFMDQLEQSNKILNIYVVTPTFSSYLEEQIDELLKTIETDVSVNVYDCGGYSWLYDKLVLNSSSGASPCSIAVTYSYHLFELESKYYDAVDVTDLCKAGTFDDYNSGLWNSWKADNKLKAVPMSWTTQIGLANSDALEIDYKESTSEKIKSFDRDFETLFSEVNNVLSPKYGSLTFGADYLKNIMINYCINNNITLPSTRNKDNEKIIKGIFNTFHSLLGSGFSSFDHGLYGYPSTYYQQGRMPLEMTSISSLNYSLNESFNTSYFIPSFGDKIAINSIGAAYYHLKGLETNCDEVDSIAKLIYENILTSDECIAKYCNGGYLSPKDTMMADLTGHSQNYSELSLPAFSYVVNSNILDNCYLSKTMSEDKQYELLLQAFNFISDSEESIDVATDVYFDSIEHM